MNEWLKCRYGHVFHSLGAPEKDGIKICPKCQVAESDAIPVAVVESVKRFAQRRGKPTRDILCETTYYHSMGCFGFNLDGVFYGVEPDGYLHT